MHEKDSGSRWSAERHHLVMLALVLVLGLANMFFGDIVPAGGGLGWDGTWYAQMVKDLPNLIADGRIGTYYAQRILPAWVVRLALLVTHQSLERPAIIRAFQILNLLELAVACLVWKVIADRLLLGRWGRWFGFLSLFGNFSNSKMVFFYPVLTDTTAFLAGMLMVWFALARRRVALFLCTVVFAFAWPAANLMGVFLLLFPTHGAIPERRSSPPPRPLYKRSTLAFVSALSLLVPGPVLAPLLATQPWLADAGNLALLPSLYLYGLGCLVLVRTTDWRALLRNTLAAFSVVQAGLAVLALVIPSVIMHKIANPAVVNPSSVSLLRTLTLTGRPLVGIIAAALYCGPAVLFLALRFPLFLQHARQHGLGYLAVVAFTMVLVLPSEPRFVVAGWPFAVAALAKVADCSTGPAFRKAFVVLTILLGQWWLPLTLVKWPGADSQFLLDWPKQLFFMHFGITLAPSTYLLDVAIVALAALTLRWTLSSRRVPAPASVQEPVSARA